MDAASGFRIIRQALLLQAAAGAVIALPAYAQTAVPATGAAPANADQTGPADIIVTATRRAENIQTVPLSVTAITGQALEDEDIHDLSRLDVLVPGFKFGASGNDARPAIRGTRTQQVVGNADPLVAFYNDGIYRSRPSQALGTFVDVDRVEVLRGPQGTLFGRNSFAGAINVISRAPKLGELDYGGSAEVTNYEGLRVEGFVNVPVGDDVAIRLSGYESRRDGWVNNLSNTSNRLHDDDNQLIRGQIKWTPSADFTNTLRVEYWHGGGAGPGDYGYYYPGVPVDTATGYTNGVKGVVDPVISPGTVNNPLVAGHPNYDGGFPGLAPGTLGDPNYKTISTNYPAVRRINQLTISDEATLGLGDFADLKGTFSYTKYNEYRQADPDYSSQPLVYENSPNLTDTFTEELQLTSKAGHKLSWVAGVYLLQDKPRGGFNYGTDTGTTPVQLYSADPVNGYFSGLDGSYTNSYAGYADGTYRLTDWFRVLGGVRYTKDDKRGYFNSNAGTTLPPVTTITARASFNRVTYRAGFQVDVAPHAMLYGTYSTGYLAGGLNADSNPITVYQPTYSSAFEAGAKATLLDGKLRADLAVYRNRYSNIITQILTTLPNGAVVTTAANAGKIKAYGVEGELAFYPTHEAYLGLNFAYNHSRFGQFIAPNSFWEGGNITAGGCTSYCPFQLDGLQVPLNPTFSGTAIASYDIKTATGVFTPSATVFYSSSYRTADQPYFFANQKSYASVDASLRWRPNAASKLQVEGFVTNLTDHRILLRTTPNGGEVIDQDFANPRMYGVRASFNY